MNNDTPWQLRMFRKTLKKQMRLRNLKRMLGSISNDAKCLLVTSGDNNGAMNYNMRGLGGQWSWADLEDTSIVEMSELLGEEVKHVVYNELPYPDNYFEIVISIDCLEHMENPVVFTQELQRITRPNGRVIITVPGGQKTKIANMIKNMLGMTKEKYGHVVDGYSAKQLNYFMRQADLIPVGSRTFSRFFTEMLELGINFLYVMVLSKKSKVEVEEGTIAPATEEQLHSVEKTYKMYSLIYPFFKIISSLDYLLFFTRGYVVIVEGRK